MSCHCDDNCVCGSPTVDDRCPLCFAVVDEGRWSDCYDGIHCLDCVGRCSGHCAAEVESEIAEAIADAMRERGGVDVT